tara:strand:+ start:228 stop:443 length:216 start_codon:yes stop_codon:yes gene_type:complete
VKRDALVQTANRRKVFVRKKMSIANRATLDFIWITITNVNKLFAHVQMAKLMQIVQTTVTKNVHRVTLAFA